jgi:short-subunit dehydrogenase
MKKEFIIITGGGSGIGAELSRQFLQQGEKVLGIDISEQGLSEMNHWAQKMGHEFKGVFGDVTKIKVIEDIIQEIQEKNHRIKIWINCAGVSGIGEFQKLDKLEFDRVVELNLLSIVNSTRLVLKHMEGEGVGTIVNISSVAGFVPAPLMSAYNLTKHALVGFTRSLQQEMRYLDSPVKFILVAPGFVDTGMIKRGEELGFPNWLSSILSTPDKVAKEIIEGIKKNQLEIYPTLNGKALLKLHSLFPEFTRKKAKLLSVKNFKDFILNRH